MPDSVIDLDAARAAGAHNFASYYPDPSATVTGIATIAR